MYYNVSFAYSFLCKESGKERFFPYVQYALYYVYFYRLKLELSGEAYVALFSDWKCPFYINIEIWNKTCEM